MKPTNERLAGLETALPCSPVATAHPQAPIEHEQYEHPDLNRINAQKAFNILTRAPPIVAAAARSVDSDYRCKQID